MRRRPVGELVRMQKRKRPWEEGIIDETNLKAQVVRGGQSTKQREAKGDGQ